MADGLLAMFLIFGIGLVLIAIFVIASVAITLVGEWGEKRRMKKYE